MTALHTDDPESSINSVHLPPTFPATTVACFFPSGYHNCIWAHWLVGRLLPITDGHFPAADDNSEQGVQIGHNYCRVQHLADALGNCRCPMPSQLKQRTIKTENLVGSLIWRFGG